MILIAWSSLSAAMKVLWGITLAASVIFVIQSIMTFLGADADSDLSDIPDDADASGLDGGTNLLTFRNFINFILGFGWSAILLQDSIKSKFLLILVSAVIGVGLVTAVMFLFKWLAGMQQSGNINVEKQAKGCEGTVYLTVPASRSAAGKIQIKINGAVREYDAVTDSPEPIGNGTPIRVLDVLGPETLLVEKI